MSNFVRKDGVITKLPRDIIGKLSRKYNMPEHIIEIIVRSEFKFIETTLKKKQFTAVRLHYLGVFGVPEYRLVKIKEQIEKSKNEGTIINS